MLFTRNMTVSFLLTVLVLTVLLFVVLASSAFGDTGKEVANQLSDFNRTAFEMRSEAGTLKSITSNQRLSWHSHTYRLDALREHVNTLGKTLAELETQKSAATESQAMAIEQARPHLVSVAQNLTQAIELVRQDRSNVHREEYAEAVNNIYVHANELRTKVDTILDYEATRMRLDKLELQLPSTAGG